MAQHHAHKPGEGHAACDKNHRQQMRFVDGVLLAEARVRRAAGRKHARRGMAHRNADSKTNRNRQRQNQVAAQRQVLPPEHRAVVEETARDNRSGIGR